MDPKFLRDVQDKGWWIEAVTQKTCLASCPVPGCGMMTQLRQGARVPPRAPGSDNTEVQVTDYEAVRVLLRERREQMGLSIREVEEDAGMAVDFLAKFERDTWNRAGTIRLPNLATFIEWAQVLGFEVYIRKGPMPPKVLRTIAQTREVADARKRQISEAQRRRELRAASDAQTRR